ncbi:MAG: agmatine deiminase family protein [Gammaproteobacteria bacterium]|nr:agmatine deiminase family protein [Gammaproteobacteria bacterium]
MQQRFFPPEWHPQSGVLLTWPHSHSDWADILDRVEPVFVEIGREIAKRQNLLIVAYNDEHRAHIQRLLEKADVNLQQVSLHCVPSDDTWARDFGPITVYEGEQARLLDFVFNGWGNKFSAKKDTAITQALYKQDCFPLATHWPLDFVLEGGSIESDGMGTVLTTAHCLMSPQRNPQYSRDDVTEYLKKELGLERLLWLEHGHLEGDDTDSHIDTLARYTDANTICYVQCDDTQDSHYQDLKAMEDELKQLVDFAGKPYRLIPLPWPSAKYSPDDGHRLPATYANFLIINGAVLVPTYDDANDDLALQQVQKCFPEYEIVGINCLPIIEQHGSLHCLTMQLPEGVLA